MSEQQDNLRWKAVGERIIRSRLDGQLPGADDDIRIGSMATDFADYLNGRLDLIADLRTQLQQVKEERDAFLAAARKDPHGSWPTWFVEQRDRAEAAEHDRDHHQRVSVVMADKLTAAEQERSRVHSEFICLGEAYEYEQQRAEAAELDAANWRRQAEVYELIGIPNWRKKAEAAEKELKSRDKAFVTWMERASEDRRAAEQRAVGAETAIAGIEQEKEQWKARYYRNPDVQRDDLVRLLGRLAEALREFDLTGNTYEDVGALLAEAAKVIGDTLRVEDVPLG